MTPQEPQPQPAPGPLPAVLVLEGALSPAGAALVTPGRTAALALLPEERQSRADLFAAARRVMAELPGGVTRLGGVAAGTGPGSFTGLRVALGLARGLGLGLSGLKVAGVDSLTLLAAAAGETGPARVGVPWGRSRVLIAWSGCCPPPDPPRLVFREEITALAWPAGQELIVPPVLAALPLPAGVRLRLAEHSGVETLARLVESGDPRVGWGGALNPCYLVPPDAVLPRPAHPPLGIAPPRLLTVADLDGLVALERASFAHPWTRGQLAEELQPRKNRLALGVDRPEGGLQAAGLARLDADILSILSVAVCPEARGQGLGRLVVREMVERARKAGAYQADLEVRVSNTPAVALYAEEGFVAVGRRRGYYADGEDALLMSLLLRRAGS